MAEAGGSNNNNNATQFARTGGRHHSGAENEGVATSESAPVLPLSPTQQMQQMQQMQQGRGSPLRSPHTVNAAASAAKIAAAKAAAAAAEAGERPRHRVQLKSEAGAPSTARRGADGFYVTHSHGELDWDQRDERGGAGRRRPLGTFSFVNDAGVGNLLERDRFHAKSGVRQAKVTKRRLERRRNDPGRLAPLNPRSRRELASSYSDNAMF